MEIIHKLPYLLVYLLLTSCMPVQAPVQQISDVYVEDFQTEDMDVCSPYDVDLNNDEAEQFFLRAKKVEYEIIHDHYNVAPCYIEGVLTFGGRACEWKIQASSIGSIKCNDDVGHYVCDSCGDLFH